MSCLKRCAKTLFPTLSCNLKRTCMCTCMMCTGKRADTTLQDQPGQPQVKICIMFPFYGDGPLITTHGAPFSAQLWATFCTYGVGKARLLLTACAQGAGLGSTAWLSLALDASCIQYLARSQTLLTGDASHPRIGTDRRHRRSAFRFSGTSHTSLANGH